MKNIVKVIISNIASSNSFVFFLAQWPCSNEIPEMTASALLGKPSITKQNLGAPSPEGVNGPIDTITGATVVATK